jgi:diamine N-acetyltransferase
MVDHRAQGRGFGERALRLVIEHARAQPGIERVTLSYVPGPGGPQPFYVKAGFEETGVVEDGERVMALRFA